MTGFHWDTTQADALSLDLSKAPERIQHAAPSVFARGAFEIKNRIKRAAGGHRFLPELDRHVSYDRLGLLDYEIGFDKVGQGNLANIAVYGSINNAPVMLPPAILAREEIPAIERHLADVGEEAVLGGDSQ